MCGFDDAPGQLGVEVSALLRIGIALVEGVARVVKTVEELRLGASYLGSFAGVVRI